MRIKYLMQLAGLSALWGASFMLTQVSVRVFGPNLSATIRMALAAAVLAVIMRALGQRWPLRHWKELFLLGLLAVAGPHILYSQAAVNLPAGYAALLSVTSMLFGAFAAAWFQQEQLTPAKLLGCVLGLVGAALVVRLGPVEPTPPLLWAAALCVGGAALSGISTPFLKEAISRMEPLSITAGMHLCGVVIMLPAALHDLPAARFSWTALASIAVLGVLTSGLAYWMYIRIMRHVPPMAALSSTFMTTGFGVLWAVLFLGEPTGPVMAAGGGLILLACLLVAGLNPLRWGLLILGDKP